MFMDKNGDYIEVPDGEGGCKWVVGFLIRVTKRVVQDTLPSEDRIPATLEGVPVQILEDPYVITQMNCGGRGSRTRELLERRTPTRDRRN